MVTRYVRAGCLVIAAAAMMGQSVQAAGITITPSTTYQTMDGIGAFWGMPTLFRPAGSFWMDRPTAYDIDRFVTDFGATLVRFDLPSTCSPAQGAPYDWTPAAPHLQFMRELIRRGVNRFNLTVWSPPAWMKYTKSAIQGGVLDPANADAYGDYLAAFCKMVKDSTGVEPYALSVQNEPQFSEPYESAIMGDDAMNNQYNITQPKLTALGLTTRFFGAEHMMWAGIGPYTNTVQNQYLYAFAVHGYTEGVTPDYGSDAAWIAIRNGVPASKKVWMTESSPLPATALLTAESIHMSIVSGQLSGWTWWQYADNCGTYAQSNSVNTSWTPNAGYYGTKHYARFVRPGAVRIGCGSDVTTLWATAFKNTDNSYAIVLVNTGTGAQTVNVTGLTQTWNVYQTSGSNNCALVGTSNGTGLSVPGSAVVTLLSGTPAPVLAADTTANSLPAPTPDLSIGLLNAKGDDLLDLWLNGVKISNVDAGTIGRKVAVKGLPDTNIIACKVVNQAWGGGFIGSMMLPGGDTLRTNGTWKVTYKDPTVDPNWIQLTYNDTKWGYAKDIGPANIWPGFERWGSSAVNLYFENAHWILGATHTYFRKVITFASALSGNIYVRGNNFNYKIFIDGTQAKTGTEFASCSGGCFTVATSTTPYNFAAGSTHSIAYDITDASTDGNGVLMKAGYTRSGSSAVPMDTTWWCADSAPAGWNTVAYTDTVDWSHPNVISAYDAGSGAGNFIYPGVFYFRKKFTSTQATEVLAQIQKLMQRDRVVAVKYYTLQGREFTGDLRKAQLSKTMLIQRTVYKSGRIEDVKQLRVH